MSVAKPRHGDRMDAGSEDCRLGATEGRLISVGARAGDRGLGRGRGNFFAADGAASELDRGGVNRDVCA